MICRLANNTPKSISAPKANDSGLSLLRYLYLLVPEIEETGCAWICFYAFVDILGRERTANIGLGINRTNDGNMTLQMIIFFGIFFGRIFCGKARPYGYGWPFYYVQEVEYLLFLHLSLGRREVSLNGQKPPDPTAWGCELLFLLIFLFLLLFISSPLYHSLTSLRFSVLLEDWGKRNFNRSFLWVALFPCTLCNRAECTSRKSGLKWASWTTLQSMSWP